MAAANIRLFGNKVSFSVKESRTHQVLGPCEQSLFWDLQTRQPAELEDDCRQMLDRGSLFYQTVKDKLAHLAQVWDAAIDMKDIYDETAGVYPQDEEFMRGFLFCVMVLPDRANWGHEGSEIYQYQRSIASQGTLPRSILDEHLLPPLPGLRASQHPVAHALESQDSDVESFALTPVDPDCVVVKEEPQQVDTGHFDAAYYSERETATTEERSLGTLLATNCVRLDIPVDPPRTQYELSPEAYKKKRAHRCAGMEEPKAKVAKRS
ncbi:hypothetical protein SPBR_06157 [Sporothrix brasiliensis 5110]|uniref:Uncharacterized protein n=1 Tax=Sporothrix brasiliensis 5110 TaxID=1398154 RepID=A0A0C2F5R7_9PEZI|nr:uncharacterized protein SPBR_06157 [Sporothrix brasiliensis 5110]KIH94239.1 hypothetical protein SPBR_06157 [Sporothrix brasiliensis 5110]